jgi:MYXO-CTERM domain-containing protein
MPFYAEGNTNVAGNDDNVPINDGAYVDGTNAAEPNLFRTPELIKNQANDPMTGSVAFSDIPYFNFDNSLYFQFVYDMQETSGKRQVNIDTITISAGGQVVWELDTANYGSLILNQTGFVETDTPLGAGGDMALYIPVALFNGLGLVGSDLLTFYVDQSLADNGGDEWVVLSDGTFFDDNDPINDPPTPIPEPKTMMHLGLGLVILAGAARRRRKRQDGELRKR